MKAIVQSRYGPPEEVLRLVLDAKRPEPKPNELLVRVHAASIHADIWHTVMGFPRVLRLMGGGVRRPKQPIPGTDLAGVVDAAGKDVTRFSPGDEVFGQVVGENQWMNGGTFGQYAVIREDRVERKPGNVSFEQAAAVPTSGLIAWANMVDYGKVADGERVLVNGAGGSLGIFAVQLAKAYGAHVTAVDAAAKLPMLRKIGADEVIDYTSQDYTKTTEPYDLIFDVASNRSYREIRRALTPEGRFILIGHDHYDTVGRQWLGSIPRVFGLLARAPFDKRVSLPSGPRTSEPLRVLGEMVEDGRIKPVVDKVFHLEEVVPALRYLASGEPKGKVVLKV